MKSSVVEAAEMLLKVSGDDPRRTGLVRTPYRFASAWEELTSGYDGNLDDILQVFEERDCGDGMIFQGSIPFFSLCEHHLLPFFGVIHFAYLPRLVHNVEYSFTKIVGLSKIPRLVDIFARRLQVQERLTNQIVDAFFESRELEARGGGCVIRARHLCMEMRGIQKIGTTTITSALRGLFLEDASVRQEFLAFVRSADEGLKSI